MKRIMLALLVGMFVTAINAQETPEKVYNDDVRSAAGRSQGENPLEQIDQALLRAKSEGKFVVCQVGGDWCPWCLRFADFIARDTTISKVIADNFEYIHVDYNPRRSEGAEQVRQASALMKRLHNCGRFGFPVFVVLDEEGNVIHIQDSSFLEESAPETARRPGEGAQRQWYNQEKVLRFFKNWTPKAVKN